MKTPRTVFALPFVIIASCGGPKGASDPVEPVTKTELAAPPEGTPTKTDGVEGTVLTYPSGDKVYVGKDGTCHAQYKEHCDTGTDEEPVVSNCNPPPPQQVRCPAEAK